MQISCPECSSKFNLPDQYAKPGAKLRCTVCQNVFRLPGAQPPPPPPPPEELSMPQAAYPAAGRGAYGGAPKKSRLKLVSFLICAFLAILVGVGSWFYFAPGGDSGTSWFGEKWASWFGGGKSAESGEDVAKKVEMLTMRNVRQYNLLNEKTGKIFVIEGKVVNEFPEPKDLIELEGAIYDANKNPIEVKKQLAGSQLSLFQLQVLTEKEMEAFLNNKMEILANNTNIPPGGEAPFMILFYNPPDDVSEFGVKIVDVKDSAPEK